MSDLRIAEANRHSRAAWNTNASFWDKAMGVEGNRFVNELIWPAVEPMLDVRPGQRVLDAACGNGVYARKLAALGADVVAFDFAPDLIERAKSYPPTNGGAIDYRVADATDEAGLLAMGEAGFDAASCQMALFDMPAIAPLMAATAQLLKPGCPFVVSIVHPSFNQSGVFHMAELSDEGGELMTTYSVKVSRYMTPYTELGAAIAGQPQPQPYFHRPLQNLLDAAFAAGYVLDALAERAFAPDGAPGSEPLRWGPNFSEIPPVMVFRLRTTGR